MNEAWERQVIERLYRTHNAAFKGTNEELDFEHPFDKEFVKYTTPSRKYFGNSLWDVVTFWREHNDRSYYFPPTLKPKHLHRFTTESENTKQRDDIISTSAQLRNLKTLRRKYQPMTYKPLPTKLQKPKPFKLDPDLDKNMKRVIPTLSNTFAPIDFYASYPNLTQQLRRYMMEAEHLAADITSTNTTSKLHDNYLLDREFQMQLRIDPDYTKKLASKLTKVKDKYKFLEQEKKILLDRGKKRETEIQQSIRFLYQHMNPGQPTTIVTKPQKKQKQVTVNDMALNYRTQRELEINKRIMNVFDRPELFDDPFGLGLEPSIHVKHPVYYDAQSVFDARPEQPHPPPQEHKKNRYQRYAPDPLPLLPKRRTRITSSIPYYSTRYF
jgi:hypothetical protein